MPLRPELFNRLKEFFGHVRIANEGESAMTNVVVDALTDKKVLNVVCPGEYYAVSCPFCYDTRQRLWINHLWGYLHPGTDSLNLGLAYCYNANCLAVPGRARLLYHEVFSDFDHDRRDVILTATRSHSPPVVARMPGFVTPVKTLGPSHPARVYLESRSYDVSLLSDVLKVGLCLRAELEYRLALNRIIIPVYAQEQLAGWQARLVGDPAGRDVPKYYSMLGMKKSHLLYNLDLARRYKFGVVMEGCTDVWSFGPEAVALFGKTASGIQQNLIAAAWKKVYIVLDADAGKEATALYEALGDRVREKFLVRLPEGKDPGSIPTAELRELVLSTAPPPRA